MRLNTYAVRRHKHYYDQSCYRVRRQCEDTRQEIIRHFQGQARCTGINITHGWLGIAGLPGQCSFCGAAV